MDDWDHLLASSESLVHGVGLSSLAIDEKTAACLNSNGSLLLRQRLYRDICAAMHLTLAAGSAGNAQSQPYNGPGAAAVRKTGV